MSPRYEQKLQAGCALKQSIMHATNIVNKVLKKLTHTSRLYIMEGKADWFIEMVSK